MVLAAIAVLVGATVQSATGFGFALIIAPALFGVYDAGPALLVSLTLGIALSVLVLGSERRRLAVRREELSWTMSAAVPGIFVGLAVFAALDKGALQILVGVAILVVVAVRIAKRGPSSHQSAGRPLMAATGLISGVMTTTTGANGPPIVLLLERVGASPSELRDTLAASFIALDVAGIVLLATTSEGAEFPPLAEVALLVALTAVGHAAGRQIFRRIGAGAFRVAVLILVVAVGVASIVAGLSGN